MSDEVTEIISYQIIIFIYNRQSWDMERENQDLPGGVAFWNRDADIF